MDPELEAQRAALGDVIAQQAPVGVLCRVCDVQIDSETGDPLEPVTHANVAAVREYLTEAGQAEEGGVVLL